MGTLSPQKPPLGAAMLATSIRYDKDENDSRWNFSLGLGFPSVARDAFELLVGLVSARAGDDAVHTPDDQPEGDARKRVAICSHGIRTI